MPCRMRILISPKYDGGKVKSGAIEDCIDVYEDRVKGWFLGPARALTKVLNSAFAVLIIALSYFEGYAAYKFGADSSGKSKKFFRNAFLEVFVEIRTAPGHANTPITPDMLARVADILYEDGRCGLFHDGMSRKRVIMARASAPISVSVHKQTSDINGIAIDAEKFLAAIEVHLERYYGDLRDPTNMELREKFMRAWKLKTPTDPWVRPPGGIP